MKPARRPRGEKPATTIRYLRRQIDNLEISLIQMRNANADQEKIIAGYDVQVSEMAEEIHEHRSRGAQRNLRLAELSEQIRRKSERLSYLEGYYYAMEKPWRLAASETDAGASQGDRQNVRNGG